LANAFGIAERYREAEDAARKSIECLDESESHAACAFQVLTEVLEHQGRYEEALSVIADAESRCLAGVLTEFTKAGVLLSMGRNEEALESIETCLTMEWPVGQTGDYGIFTYKRTGLYGQILAAVGRLDEAQTALEQALKIADHPKLRWSYANVLERLGRYQDALNSYRIVMNHPGNVFRVQSGIGRCAKHLGDWTAAADACEAAWKEKPQDMDAWNAWCEAAKQTGDVSLQLRAFEEFAQKFDPSSSMLINWGRTLFESGRGEEALRHFNDAIQKNPDDANAYFNCGDLLYGLGHFPEAANYYESGLRRNPDCIAGWFVMGNALAQMGLIDGARVAYRQCLQLDANHEQARHNLDVIQDAAA
jgi:tetratricopeptide (TPR) repeat protein